VATVLSERVDEIRRARMRGGSWLARRAVEALVEVAEEPADDSESMVARLGAAGRELAASAPAVGAVAGAVGRVLAAAKLQCHLSPEQLRQLVRDEAEALVGGTRRASASIAIQLAERLTDATVLTHSESATVREALLRTPPARVLCTVSAPGEEGRTFSDDLREAGLEVELVEDEEAPAALEWASLLLVGADTVYHDGALCNKVGTRFLAEAAASDGVPAVVAAELIKLAPFTAAEAGELRADRDLTPPDLLEQVVTEEGAFPPEEIGALVDRTPFLREGYALLSSA
jgi:translation initiation factor 2B subunit (eIF-2B alpha/beta/delta family)